ncbi:MAG: outer membrane lipoprotein carrier protein LolA [Bdellovibrionales bacterium GWB1_55_8]|nr:MAG: outer membrane lipoprotein carrier protein LolA [Bdellovibrionales bacterium GWB1_55_8]
MKYKHSDFKSCKGLICALTLAVVAFLIMMISVPDKIHAAKAAGTSLPEQLKKVEENYTKGKTVRARFSQINESAATKNKETTSGVILFKRPKKFRWDTQKPEPHLLVSDGNMIWSYTPPFDETEPGQLIEQKASKIQSPLAQTLLSGAFSAAKGMKIERLGPASFRLFPKKGTAGTVARATVDVDPVRFVLRKIVLEHRDGNRAEIVLTEVELGVSLEDSLFHFTPPPNTDRVKQ